MYLPDATLAYDLPPEGYSTTWTEEGPGFLNMVVSMSEGKVVQFIAGSLGQPKRRILNVRIIAVGINPQKAGEDWLYLGRLLKLTRKGRGISFDYRGDVSGRIDSKGRVGTIALPDGFDYSEYDSGNVPALSRGPYFDPYRF